MIAFDADTAERWAKQDNRKVIMVRPETKPDDVHGMLAAEGIVTSRGGRTSHAALVARQFGKPAVVGVSELETVAKEVVTDQGVSVSYKFGTMIEVPRAALTADDIAKTAQFFSFGTNDLTQTVYGISRDDAEAGFLVVYLEQGILTENPFATIDQEGVGKLMQLAVELGRKTRSDLEVGICGEHGGDPKTIHFCHDLGLNYVSCSPYRVPIARLAAAHAELQQPRKVKRESASKAEKAEVMKS